MADNKNENLNQDYSNAVMSHTSEAIPASDFIRSNNDIEKNLKYSEKVKLLAGCMDTIKA